MFQKFNVDTLGGRFIKSLLAQTPIPVFDCVVDGDHIVEGCYYVYKRYIIKCASSGIINVSKEQELYPSSQLYPSVYLFPRSGIKLASFYVISLVDTYDFKCYSTYRSTTNSYDSETHYQLSRYLKYLYVTSGLNLFPFYNCYTSKYFSDVELFKEGNTVSIRRTSNQKTKVVAVPIMFGRTYTIAIDCPTEVLMRACIHDDTGFIPEDKLPKGILPSLNNSGRVYSTLQFRNLKTFRIECSDKQSIMLQRNLYLLIQLPLNNNSSIVVLENYKDNSGVHCNESYVRNPQLSELSLLKFNTKESYAFSDRLIEYLLNNVVFEGDNIAENVAKVQTALSKEFPSYYRSFLDGSHIKGVWDKDISRLVSHLVEEYSKSNVIYDQDGNINKDVELIIYPKGGNY